MFDIGFICKMLKLGFLSLYRFTENSISTSQPRDFLPNFNNSVAIAVNGNVFHFNICANVIILVPSKAKECLNCLSFFVNTLPIYRRDPSFSDSSRE